MLCDTCTRMLRGQHGRIWKGTWDLNFRHHTSGQSLRRSADTHCRICRVLFEELQAKIGLGKDKARKALRVTDFVGLILRILVRTWRIVSHELSSFVCNLDAPATKSIHGILNLLWSSTIATWIIGMLNGLYVKTGLDFDIERHSILRDVTSSEELWDELTLSTRASLSLVQQYGPRAQGDREHYRLDFKVQNGDPWSSWTLKRTFILERVSDASDPLFRTPLSQSTSSDEVYNLCEQWIHRCQCVPDDNSWYPARLISLESIRTGFLLNRKSPEANRALGDHEVRLVETSVWGGKGPSHHNTRYVTLSHCWGKNLSNNYQMNASNIEQYLRGRKVKTLPKTYRDAIEFAARLPKVGYIWIDSLCIKQGDKADWLEQSAAMEKVYRNTFLNISATDASTCEGGLFRNRKPDLLLEDEVILNIAGLPNINKPPTSPERSNTFPGAVNGTPRYGEPLLRRCTILDAPFWTQLVDGAAVNRRGWVLQERLMAPKVVHFCKDQVAWECREFDAAEGLPQDMPIFHMTRQGVFEEGRFKGIDPAIDGARLRRIRLKGVQDPDTHLHPHIHWFELWRRIVEVYSTTALTNSEDKLIALSGMARWMSRSIAKSSRPARLSRAEQDPRESPGTMTATSDYIAGLWAWYLESQLLWWIEPVFREEDSSFHNRSTRPAEFRAPSYSWASLDAHAANGVRYAEVTDRDLYIEVLEASITAQEGSDSFGLITDGYIRIRGKLRKAEIMEQGKGRVWWKFLDREGLDDEKDQHTNVYLDCPDRDLPNVIGRDAGVFVVPAAKGSRLAPEEDKYLICLLLQLQRSPRRGITFRRIGITKLSSWADSMAFGKILEVEPSDVDMPHQGYDPSTGMHEIVLI